MLAHSYSQYREVKAESSGVQGHPQLHSESDASLGSTEEQSQGKEGGCSFPYAEAEVRQMLAPPEESRLLLRLFPSLDVFTIIVYDRCFLYLNILDR